MFQPIITARPLGGNENYLPVSTQPLSVTCACEGGTGEPEAPWQLRLQIQNTWNDCWRGVLRIALPVDEESRFFLPGFLYGSNRGDAPLVVDSNCPRLRKGGSFPASGWWMVRSDRLSHPAAFAYAGGRMIGFAATPYLVGQHEPWQPGKAGVFDQYAGFGCSADDGQLFYTLGYENAPWFFLDAHQYSPRAPLGDNCLTLQAGESLSVCLHCFDYPAEDERALHAALGLPAIPRKPPAEMHHSGNGSQHRRSHRPGCLAA